ncbi:MAG: photosystem II protein Y [Cyanobacteria bacterium CRU_2_1]|nr:photosystem II protein Y [Cyanobacteria bacterium RU_5_0]NJR58423.1 photosystem II protein Y [Cyanobacteria bacterium CRU_2_1]
MDWRLLIVFLPLALALAWVARNIGQDALKQGQNFLEK